MTDFNRLLESFLGGTGGHSDWLWAVEDTTFQRHLATRAMAQRLQMAPVAANYLKRSGSIAVIPVHGILMKDPYYYDEVSTPAIAQAILQAGSDDSFEAIVMDFETPGGSCAGLAECADAIDAVGGKKPLYAQCSGMMCSAGYYLAATAKQIYTQRMDLTGSIGTRMQLYDFSKLFANIGISPVTIDTGPLKSTGVLGAEITDQQKEYLQSICDRYQQDFASRVIRGRSFNADQYAAVATGAVFLAEEALKLGLVDGIQTLDATLAALVVAGNGQKQKGKKMSTTASTDAPAREPATAAQLKAEFPDSSAEFRMDQLEKGATIAEAHKAYSAYLGEQLAKEKEARDAAEKKAAEAEKAKGSGANTKPANQVRGNKLAAASGEGASEGQVDYYQMAKEYQEKHKCRWSEACLEIKRRYPDSRAVFGAPPKQDR